MEKEYDTTNRGSIFKNDKEGNEARPDYKGSINADGVDYWASVWIKTSKGGMKYMSLVLEKKETQSGKKAASKPAPKQQSMEDMDNDIPF